MSTDYIHIYCYEATNTDSVIEYLLNISPIKTQLGHTVAQLVEALRYRPEGRGFDSRWCHWNFSLT